jgi:DNA-binding NtrC family response regulator
MAKALLVDDDRRSLDVMRKWVAKRGFDVSTASSLDRAREACRTDAPDLILLDLELPDGSGLDLVAEMEESADLDPRILVISGTATIETAVEAMRGGAMDVLQKPVDLDRLEKILEKIRASLRLREKVGDLRAQLRDLGRFGPLVGRSASMQEVYDLISKVAPTDATVFILGETGCGKDLVANAVHAESPRASQPFVPVNCGAIPENLIESELFGHEKGAFTGATSRRQGFFEQANGGTLFLDEITEMPLELQVKLLRVLETGRVRRVGGDRSLKVDVRVVAASNRDPEEAVADGRLRDDLLYRLMVFPIPVPPLRDREGDVELLAEHFLRENNDKRGTSARFLPEALELLAAHEWPGNVRELRNVVDRASILGGDRIGPRRARRRGHRPRILEGPSGCGAWRPPFERRSAPYTIKMRATGNGAERAVAPPRGRRDGNRFGIR